MAASRSLDNVIGIVSLHLAPPISFLGGLAFMQALSHSSSKFPYSQLPIHKGRRAPDPQVSGKALSPSSHQLSVDVVPLPKSQCE